MEMAFKHVKARFCDATFVQRAGTARLQKLADLDPSCMGPGEESIE